MTAGSFPGGLYTRAVAVLARLLVPHGCLHVFPQHLLSWDEHCPGLGSPRISLAWRPGSRSANWVSWLGDVARVVSPGHYRARSPWLGAECCVLLVTFVSCHQGRLEAVT